MPSPNSRTTLGCRPIECLEDRVCPSYLYTTTPLYTAPTGTFTDIWSDWSVNNQGDVAFIGELPFVRGQVSGSHVFRVRAGSGNLERLSELQKPRNQGTRVQIDDNAHVLMSRPPLPIPSGPEDPPKDGQGAADGTVFRYTGGVDQIQIVSTSAGVGLRPTTTMGGEATYLRYSPSTARTQLVGGVVGEVEGYVINSRLIAAGESGTVVFKAGTRPDDPIRLFGGGETVAGGQNGFTTTGDTPGISDDGQLVAFYGDLTPSAAISLQSSPGPGIFVWSAGGSIRRVTVSTVRWLVIDTVHHCTGIRPAVWDFARLGENVAAFEFLIQIHYRYYKFYANMVIALAWAYATGGYASGWWGVAYWALAALFFLGSRDALRRYYNRVGRLLAPDA